MPSPIWRPELNALSEEPGSPRWVFGERFTCTRVFQASYTLCLNSAPMRGTLGTGEMEGYSVAQATVERQRGSLGRLTIEYETLGQPAQGGQLPRTQQSIELEKLERAIDQHPRYAGLTEAQKHAIDTCVQTSTTDQAYTTARALISGVPLAMELLDRLQRKQTHYALWTPVVRITEHYWSAPTGLTAGGSKEQPPSTIMTPPAADYLRAGDSVSFNGTTWQVTRTWIGGPELDALLYP